MIENKDDWRFGWDVFETDNFDLLEVDPEGQSNQGYYDVTDHEEGLRNCAIVRLRNSRAARLLHSPEGVNTRCNLGRMENCHSNTEPRSGSDRVRSVAFRL